MEAEIYFKLILTFGLVLVAARIGGEVAERFLKQPAVVGELLAGIVISPFALGIWIGDPIILNFALIDGHLAATGEEIADFAPLEIVSQIAVIALLFVAGLETNVKSFMKNSVIGAVVALGGVVVPFIFGYFGAMFFFPDMGNVGWLPGHGKCRLAVHRRRADGHQHRHHGTHIDGYGPAEFAGEHHYPGGRRGG